MKPKPTPPFSPTDSPECVSRSADFGPDWFGPYMGFEHVELMLVGHNWFLPEKLSQGLHYESWHHADGRGDEKSKLYAQSAGDTHGAAQTYPSKTPRCLAPHDLDIRSGHRLAQLKSELALLCLGESSRSAPLL